MTIALLAVRGQLLCDMTGAAHVFSRLHAEEEHTECSKQRTRTYATCAVAMHACLVLALQLDPTALRIWFFHVEPKGRPHRVACVYDDQAANATIWNGNSNVRVEWIQLQCFLATCLDKTRLVVFGIHQAGLDDPIVSLNGLLQLHAGARRDSGIGDSYRCPGPPAFVEARALPFVPNVHDNDDEASVYVDDVLLNRLRHNFEMEVERVRRLAGSEHLNTVCKLCPYYCTRGSHRVEYMLRHLQPRHQTEAPRIAEMGVV